MSVWILGVLTLRDQERRLALSAQAAAEARVHLQFLGRAVPDRDARSRPRFRFLSEGIETMLGVGPEILIGEDVLLGQSVSARDRAALKMLLRGSQDDMRRFETEIECLRRDRRIVWISVTATPRRRGEGSLVWDGRSRT